MDLLVSRAIVDAHADLFLAGEAEAQGAAAAIGQGEAAGVELIEVCDDDLAEFGRVVYLRNEVDCDFGSSPAQDTVALGGVWVVATATRTANLA